MPALKPFAIDVVPDWQGLLQCLRRQGTPRRVYVAELFLDPEVQQAVCERFELLAAQDRADPFFEQRRHLAVQRFLGYDYVRCGTDPLPFAFHRQSVADTAAIRRTGGRTFVDEHVGPITSWAEFEAYPWPDPQSITTRALEWFETHLPEDMCLIGSGGFAHFAEYLSWLLGYETLCYALFDQRDLVAAIADRVLELNRAMLRVLLQFPQVKIIWGSDDMGFRTGTLISPDDLREFVLPAHREMARMAHEAGRPYLLHSCGQIDAIMPDLIDDVQIDGKHSFEDTIQQVADAKQRYGARIALLGGLDVDFLCRAGEAQIRQRVRQTLEICHPGGGYCLGTGNSVANYIPLDSYLAMLDEGRRFAGVK